LVLKNKLLFLSLFISVLSIFLSPAKQINNHTYSIGFPLNFIWFRSYEPIPHNRFLLFFPSYFVKTEFNILAFIFCILLLYIILRIIIKFINIIKLKV
jgi:hypothetical protein